MQALTKEHAARQEAAKEKAEEYARRNAEDLKTCIWDSLPKIVGDDCPIPFKRYTVHLKEYQGAPYLELKRWRRRKGTAIWFSHHGQHVTFSPQDAAMILEALAVAASKAEEVI